MMPRELFETRSHAWQSLGLEEELAPRLSKRTFVELLAALAVLAATLVVYYNRHRLFPGYEQWARAGTVLVLILVGSVATHWLVRGVSPQLYRRLNPATAGTVGFVIRLFAMALVVVSLERAEPLPERATNEIAPGVVPAAGAGLRVLES